MCRLLAQQPEHAQQPGFGAAQQHCWRVCSALATDVCVCLVAFAITYSGVPATRASMVFAWQRMLVTPRRA